MYQIRIVRSLQLNFKLIFTATTDEEAHSTLTIVMLQSFETKWNKQYRKIFILFIKQYRKINKKIFQKNGKNFTFYYNFAVVLTDFNVS